VLYIKVLIKEHNFKLPCTSIVTMENQNVKCKKLDFYCYSDNEGNYKKYLFAPCQESIRWE